MTTVHVMSKKAPVFYWLQASAFARLCGVDTRKETISQISSIKREFIGKKKVKKRAYSHRCSKYYFFSVFLC